jgi:putative hemolysin
VIDVEKMIHQKYPKLKKNKIIQKAIDKFADSVVHQKQINDFLHDNDHLGSFEFIENALEKLDFSYSLSNKDLQNIPASGRVIIIANHPLGGLDALALIKAISTIRKDLKIVANDFLNAIKPLEPIIIDINNFKNRQSKESINKIYDALNADEALIIFPAGEVSRATPKGVRDGEWHKSFLNFASRTSSPILPVYIGGKNSKTFYSVSALNKKLSTLLLSNEMFKQKGKEIELIIGELIPSSNTLPLSLKKDKVVELYKKHLYGLKIGISYFQTQAAIALAEDRRDIKKELKSAQRLGETKDGKIIYLYEWSSNNGSILNEIGRLREISFRQVGEGVNKRRDIDKYDRHYKHIVLWDNEELEIVGAYRIGIVSEILQKQSVEALYTNSLFTYDAAFSPYLANAIELGRSFVQPKYWGSRALDYLWQGIGAYLKNNPQIKYLYGGVSLSQSYPKVAKDMILYFYEHYFGAQEQLVRAKLPYKIDLEEPSMQLFLKELSLLDYKEDFKSLKKALAFLGLSVPTLYKQYADLCEEDGISFCAYNIDADFSECVDSFIVLSVDKIKEKQKERYFQ